MVITVNCFSAYRNREAVQKCIASSSFRGLKLLDCTEDSQRILLTNGGPNQWFRNLFVHISFSPSDDHLVWSGTKPFSNPCKYVPICANNIHVYSLGRKYFVCNVWCSKYWYTDMEFVSSMIQATVLVRDYLLLWRENITPLNSYRFARDQRVRMMLWRCQWWIVLHR